MGVIEEETEENEEGERESKERRSVLEFLPVPWLGGDTASVEIEDVPHLAFFPRQWKFVIHSRLLLGLNCMESGLWMALWAWAWIKLSSFGPN